MLELDFLFAVKYPEYLGRYRWTECSSLLPDLLLSRAFCFQCMGWADTTVCLFTTQGQIRGRNCRRRRLLTSRQPPQHANSVSLWDSRCVSATDRPTLPHGGLILCHQFVINGALVRVVLRGGMLRSFLWRSYFHYRFWDRRYVVLFAVSYSDAQPHMYAFFQTKPYDFSTCTRLLRQNSESDSEGIQWFTVVWTR